MPQIKGVGPGQIHRYCIFSFFGFMQIASCICCCFVSFSFGLKFSEIIFTSSTHYYDLKQGKMGIKQVKKMQIEP